MLRQSWLLLLVLLSFGAAAQTPAQLVAEMKKQFPGEKAVYLEQRQDLTVEIRNDSVQVLARHHDDMLHLDEQSGMYAKDQVPSSHFSRLLKLEARTLVPGEKADRYKTVRVSDFHETFDTQAGVFFDDTRTTSFVFPGVTPGARTITDFTVRHPDGRFVHPFFVGSYVPVRHAELTITAPKGVRIGYKVFQGEKANIQYTEQAKGDQIIYRWTAENLPSPPRDADGPEASYYLPHIVFFIEEATVNGQPRKLLAGVPELYTMYADFVRRIEHPEKLGATLQHGVDSLVAGASSEEEKVRRIYYWVQDNVRYIAFEQGLRGFIPHDAGLVYTRRYGDCKDMANLTYEMMRLAGVKTGYLTWVGTRDLPYHYAELATPGVDNHMIATYEPRPGEYVFLDATSKHTPYGMPSSMIQGKDGLLALSDKDCRVVSIPAMDKGRSGTNDASVLTLDGTGLRGKGHLDLTGYTKVVQSYGLDGLDRSSEPKYVKHLLERGNNKFFVDKYSVTNLDARDQPLSIDYEYRLQDYVQQLDDELYVNLNLERPYATDRIDSTTRRLPRYNEFAHTDRTRTELVIPAGYEVSYLPPAAEVRGDALGFKVNYERRGDKIIQQRELYVNYLLMQPKQFASWNAVVGKLGSAYREVVILKKKKV
jgi:transglutaminase-like putative cysteine protease